MNTTIKKIIKGTLAIFVIKLVIVSGFFVFQSCQSEEFEYRRQEESKSNFLNSLKKSNLSLSELEIRTAQKNELAGLIARDMDGATETVCLMEFNGAETSAEVISEILENVSTLGTLIQTKSDHDLITQYELVSTEETEYNEENESTEEENETSEPDYNPEDCIALIEIPLQPVVDALDPAVSSAKEFFYSKGFSESEILEMIAEHDGQEEDLIATAMLIASDEEGSGGSYANNISTLFFNSAHAQELTWGEVGSCAAAAIGADIAYALATEGGGKSDKWKKRAIRKLFGKVASRLLGPVGVAIAVVSFGTCIAAAYAT